MFGRPRVRLFLAIALAAVAGAVALLVVRTPVAFSVGEEYTGVVIDSEATHSLGGGNVFDYDPGPVAGSSNGTYVSLGVGGTWSFHFQTSDGSPLTAGTYTAGMTLPSGGTPALSITHGSTCTAAGWTYTILEAPTFSDDQTLLGFAADLVHHCSSRPTVALFASIRLESSIPTRMVHVTPVVAFPDTVEGTQSASAAVTVDNLGRDAVTVLAELVGDDPGEFQIAQNECGASPIESGASCELNVVFRPTSTMGKTAVVAVDSTATLEPRRTRLSGYGLSETTLLPMRLALSSDAGDWVGDGDNWLYDPADITGEAYGALVGGQAPGVALNSPPWPGPPWWRFQFIAPEGETLQPGRYEVPTAGWLDVSGEGHGCNFTSGWFEVFEGPTYDVDGTLLVFAADFEQHCEDSAARLRGSLRFHSTEPLTDLIPPTGAALIGDGEEFTDTAAVTMSVPASDPSDVTGVALSNDATTWTTTAYASSVSWTLPRANGTRTVWTRWRDGAGNWSASTADTIVLDTHAPSVSSPRYVISRSSRPTQTRIPIVVESGGTDATSGIARYELAQSTDGGAFGIVASTSSSSWTRWLTPGHTYRFRVRAHDRAGNRSAWVYSSSFRPRTHQETSAAIRYAGGWQTAPGDAYLGGYVRHSRVAGATAAFTSTGRMVAWVAATGPTRGSVDVFVDGVRAARVDLHAASTTVRRIVFVRKWDVAKTRIIELRVVGTQNHPRADLDAFITW